MTLGKLAAAGAVAWLLSAFALTALAAGSTRPATPERAVTFSRDIAPLLYEHCAECHHEGGTAPNPLVTYKDAKKRLRAMLKAVSSRTMPPWQPDPSWGHFQGDRRLTDEQIDLLRRWAAAGAPEGSAADLPKPPVWNDDWKLGPPDLVVQMEEPFTVPAAGRDIYRNFVISQPSKERRYVRAVEFRPGNPTVVHHAFVLVDRSGTARRQERRDGRPGFDGMQAAGASAPEGHFLSWQPGKQPSNESEDMAWALEPGSEVVVQLHIRPSGREETVQSSVGLYFTDKPPTKQPVTLLLRSTSIDIPPGESNYIIESSYTLPVDVEAFSVLPHAHYLAREMKCWADLPDGSQQPLLWIKRWNFNWQGDYRYAEPVALPKGAVLRMRYTYDNSAANPQNPNSPPKRVQYGLNTADSMGELWIQVLARTDRDRAALQRDYLTAYGLRDAMELAQALLRRNPDDAVQHAKLAAALYHLGKVDEAMSELKRSLELEPTADACFYLSVVYQKQGRKTEAKMALQRALSLDPADFRCLSNMGGLLIEAGDVAGAVPYLERAVASNPNDAVSRSNLERARAFLAGQQPR